MNSLRTPLRAMPIGGSWSDGTIHPPASDAEDRGGDDRPSPKLAAQKAAGGVQGLRAAEYARESPARAIAAPARHAPDRGAGRRGTEWIGHSETPETVRY